MESGRSMVRILYVIGSLDFGGTEKQFYLLLKYLNRNRYRPLVVNLSAEDGYWVKKIRELGVELILLPRSGHWEMARLLHLLRVIHRQKPHIVHSYQPHANIYAGLAAMISGHKRTVASHRSFASYIDKGGFPGKLISRAVYRGAGTVVCNSRSLCEDIRKRYRGRIRTQIIFNGIEPSLLGDGNDGIELRRRLCVPQDAPVVGTVGRLVAVKNHGLLLDIAEKVLGYYPNAYFVIAGDGPLRKELSDRAARLGISDRVVFTGYIDDVPRLLKIFDVFVLTTSNGSGNGEGFPNAIMEAMDCGKPCIAGELDGAKELVVDGETGYLVRYDSKNAYAERILELLRNGDLRVEMGKNARAAIAGRYAADAMVREYERLYDELLSNRP